MNWQKDNMGNCQFRKRLLNRKEMAAHSCILAWRIPWTMEPGRLRSMRSQRVGHDWATCFTFFHFLSLSGCSVDYMYKCIFNLRHFQLTMGLSGCNCVISWVRFVCLGSLIVTLMGTDGGEECWGGFLEEVALELSIQRQIQFTHRMWSFLMT